jgi:hypothetical protein
VCKLGQGEFAVLSLKASALGRHCLGRENAAAQHAWMLELEFRTEAAGRNAACFAAMDGANARLHSAFDKMFRRLYMLGQHAGSAATDLTTPTSHFPLPSLLLHTPPHRRTRNSTLPSRPKAHRSTATRRNSRISHEEAVRGYRGSTGPD